MNARYILIGTLLLLGCSDVSTSPSLLAGTWDEDFTIPGSGMEFTLAVQGDSVTGSGHWTGEACCSGHVTVSGNEFGDEVHLSFSFVTDAGAPLPPRTSEFVGRLISLQTLSGSIVNPDGSSYAETFHRAR